MNSILVIDDDEAVRGATKILLEANGFDVVAVADGQSGIMAIKDRHFDLGVIDLFMPGMSGLDTTKAILKNSPSMPVIVVSGFMFGGSAPEMPGFEAMAIEAGAKSVQYKPIRPKVFLQAINDAIGVTV
jgi:two-component system response regulator MtrA